MHVAVAMLMQMFTNNFARCEVEVYGSFCQSVEYNSPLAYCPVPLRLNLDKRDVLRDRERVQAEAARAAGAPSSAWFELACTSGALDYNQFHQPAPPRGGVSWRERSITAALEGARRGDTMSLHYLEALLLVQSAVGRTADADVGYAAASDTDSGRPAAGGSPERLCSSGSDASGASRTRYTFRRQRQPRLHVACAGYGRLQHGARMCPCLARAWSRFHLESSPHRVAGVPARRLGWWGGIL